MDKNLTVLFTIQGVYRYA